MEKQGWYKSGGALLKEIAETRLPENMTAVWYLGQAGLVIRAGETVCAVDLYLEDSGRRNFPPPFTPEEAAEAFDLVLCTHDHSDHLDVTAVGGIGRSGERARFIVPAPSAGKVCSLGIAEERVTGARVYEPITAGGISILPVPAAHESFEYDEKGQMTCLGYILTLPGCSLYHSGDTVEWEGMVSEIAPFAPDIMCLPINGSDWTRKKKNIIGNLNAREAADIADACGADLLIPLHFDLFPGNGENPACLADHMHADHPGKKFHIMVPGERFLYMK